MSLGLSTFMDTEKESEKWHRGIFVGVKKGLVVHDPRKAYKHSKASEYKISEFMDYYRNDEHYYDVPYVVTYGVSTGVALGLVSFTAQHLVTALL